MSPAMGSGSPGENFSIFHGGESSSHFFNCFYRYEYIPVIASHGYYVMRVMGHRRSKSAFPQTKSLNHTESDISRAVVAFDNGNLDQILLRIGYYCASFERGLS